MKHIPALHIVSVLLTAATLPATAQASATLDCRADTGFGPGPVSAYACRDAKSSSRFDDCAKAGVREPVFGDHKVEYCRPR